MSVRCMVMRGPRCEKPTSISFFGFSERCQYVADAIGFGTTTCVPHVNSPRCTAHAKRKQKKREEGRYAGGVDGLPAVGEVDAAGDLLDQHRRQAVLPQLLVHAQEVDLHHVHRPAKSRISPNAS